MLINSKLSIPPLRAEYVPRPRLLARLQDGLSRKLTLISTPPGFGKTTLLCEWLKDRCLPAAWVALDEGDNDHGRFISYVMAALGTLNIGLDESLGEITESAMKGIPLEPQMAAFLNGIASLPNTSAPVVLVLDDYHVIQNQTIHDSMTFALEYIPENVHIYIATRTDPSLPLSRWRARRQLNELRAQDLRFTQTEAETLFKQTSGVKLSSAQISILDDRTEGWVAGLHLAALALSGHGNADQFIRNFTGSHRYILDYLADEVFLRQPESAKNFLMKTSILERMCAGLCDAVTEETNGRSMLENLEKENLFIVPLDAQGKWYRYHHLFVELLTSRLEQLSKNEISQLHLRAALWFDAHDQPYEAIAHALNAREYDLAIRMMIKATPVMAMRGEINALLKWLHTLPHELKSTNPRIPLMYAWAYFFMTEIESVEPHLKDVIIALGISPQNERLWDADMPPQTVDMLAQVSALQTFVAVNRGEPQRGIQIAKEALSHLPADDRLSRFAVLAALGDAYRDADDFTAASQSYSEALAISKVIDQYAASLTMRMDLARLRVKMGQLHHAEAICQEVLDWDSERHHPLFPVAQAYALLGDIQRERGEFESAEQTLLAGIRQCEWAGYQRYLVYCHVSLARLKHAQGEDIYTEQALESAERTAVLSNNKPLLHWVRQFRARLLPTHRENWLANFQQKAEEMDGTFQHEDEYLTLARLKLEQTRYAPRTDLQPVTRFLERILASAQTSARKGSVIEILILQALILQRLGQTTETIEKIGQALKLADPEGYMRLFLDEGTPIADILILAIQHNIHSEYANHLLKAMKNNTPLKGLSEPLTDREGEVLRLLAAGLSNQEIAERLVISLSTIKTHITRIYAKLDVTSRTQAIVRARELKII